MQLTVAAQLVQQDSQAVAVSLGGHSVAHQHLLQGTHQREAEAELGAASKHKQSTHGRLQCTLIRQHMVPALGMSASRKRGETTDHERKGAPANGASHVMWHPQHVTAAKQAAHRMVMRDLWVWFIMATARPASAILALPSGVSSTLALCGHTAVSWSLQGPCAYLARDSLPLSP